MQRSGPGQKEKEMKSQDRCQSGLRSHVLLSLLFCLLAVCFLCGACGKKMSSSSESLIPISIAENDRITVQNNGQWAQEGEDAAFSLIVEENYHITDVDYDGEYTLSQNKTHALLTLKDVKYPTQVHLTVQNQVWELTYEPNGAPGEAVTVYEEQGTHLRPNTSKGTDLFSREGYTLLGWNTEADGSGTEVGLGSRVTASDGKVTLYAQWAEWTPVYYFSYIEDEEGIMITDCSFDGEELILPETIDGFPVTRIAAGAFKGLPFRVLSLPASLQTAEDGAVAECGLEKLYLFDSIESISNAAFVDCPAWKTVRINAAEEPFGTYYYKESCYADKVDLMILAEGSPKLVFYAGCSIWYNLDVSQVKAAYGEEYQIIDMGLNGTVSSEFQLQILNNYLEEGDVLFHTPELSSRYQMMEKTELTDSDGVLWSGLEYNYDLVSLVDAQSLGDLLGSFCSYLSGKYTKTAYASCFEDTNGRRYCGENGEVPFNRMKTTGGELEDEVNITPDRITEEGMERLNAWYERLSQKGVSVFVSYFALNMDALTTGEKDSLKIVETRFKKALAEGGNAVLISDLKDYEYQEGDFYDTNYHLLTNPAVKCTRKWLEDLAVYLPLEEG